MSHKFNVKFSNSHSEPFKKQVKLIFYLIHPSIILACNQYKIMNEVVSIVSQVFRVQGELCPCSMSRWASHSQGLGAVGLVSTGLQGHCPEP